MNNLNQLNIIKDFMASKSKVILISNLNEKVDLFYSSLLNFYASKKNIKICYDTNHSTDLFELEKINVFNENNSKNIEKLINSEDKKIIVTNYKNIKKYHKFLSINSYRYEFDIDNLISDEFAIKNDELRIFCRNNPSLVFSEISKFLINNKNYKNDMNINIDNNHIMHIRKSIYNLKRENNNIKSLYYLIKNEVIYKKFNFLVY